MNSLTMPFPPIKIATVSKRSQSSGLFAGTLVAMEQGWKPVEALTSGDRVWTFDNGLQAATNISSQVFASAGDAARAAEQLVAIPSGMLANENDLLFMSMTGLLLECENTADAFGDPFGVVPAAALRGVCGTENTNPTPDLGLFRITFERDEVIYIDNGLLVLCPWENGDPRSGPGRYDVKSVAEAQAFLTDLDFGELALREAGEDFRVEFDPADPGMRTAVNKRGAQSSSFG